MKMAAADTVGVTLVVAQCRHEACPYGHRQLLLIHKWRVNGPWDLLWK